MKCDNCRWFNKNGFAGGTGDCILHRFVCGSGHEACEHYEEYEPRPHGKWLKKDTYFGTCWATCSVCNKVSSGEGHDNGFGNDYFYPNFCPNCGADMRKRGDEE